MKKTPQNKQLQFYHIPTPLKVAINESYDWLEQNNDFLVIEKAIQKNQTERYLGLRQKQTRLVTIVKQELSHFVKSVGYLENLLRQIHSLVHYYNNEIIEVITAPPQISTNDILIVAQRINRLYLDKKESGVKQTIIENAEILSDLIIKYFNQSIGGSMPIQINSEFQKLIPSLTDAELERLESSILAEGCRDPIVVWNGIIIDGHNRYAICTEHNIEYKILEKPDLESELDVKLWMINNQFARRNLMTVQKLELAYRFKDIEEEKAKARQLAGTKIDNSEDDTLANQLAKVDQNKGKALEAVAKIAGVSHTTAEQYDAIQRKGTDEQKASVASGNSSIKKIYNDIQKSERLENLQTIEMLKGKYKVIYADPFLQSMSLKEICALPVGDIAEDDSVLFLWIPVPMLMKEGNAVLNAWQFQYQAEFIWDKVNCDNDIYNDVQHEVLLIGTKGNCTPESNKHFNSIQSIENTDDSEHKPEEFRQIIEALYPSGNKLALFGNKDIAGWEIYSSKNLLP